MTDTPKYCIVDRREPSARVQQLTYEGFTCDVPETLVESGDVILCMPDGATVGIEIKTAQEIVALVPQGLSSLAQFQRMATFTHRVLLVVGTVGRQADGSVLLDGWNRFSKLKYVAVQGALFNLQANLGFLVRHAGTEQEVGRNVDGIWEYFARPHVLLAKPRPITLSQPHAAALAVLMTLPGIGAVQADRILRQYGTLARALGYVEEWGQVPGIGPKTVRAINTFLGKEWYAGDAIEAA